MNFRKHFIPFLTKKPSVSELAAYNTVTPTFKVTMYTIRP